MRCHRNSVIAGTTAALILGSLFVGGPLRTARGAGAADGPARPEEIPPEGPQPKEPATTPEEIEKEARERFALLAESRSLHWDWSTIEEFSGTPGVEVIPTMLAEMRKVQPKGQENRVYLLASAMAGRARGRPGRGRLLDSEASALLEFARKELRDPAQVWTARNVAYALAGRPAERAGMGELILDASRPAALRAAMLLGLGEAGEASVLEMVEPILAAAAAMHNRDDAARLREAMAWAAAKVCEPLLRLERPEARGSGSGDEGEDGESVTDAWGIPREATRRGSPPGSTGGGAVPPGAPGPGAKPQSAPGSLESIRRSLGAIRDLLDEKSLGSRTRLQVMRALQHAWGTEVAYESAESWRQVAADEERKAEGQPARTAVRFFGIPSSGGNRILFLLDGSDSMLTRLTPEEKDALRALLEEEGEGDEGDAVAVEPEDDDAKGKRAGKRSSSGKTGVGSGPAPGRAGGKPWDAVTTRFDAARAHLEHTLWRMAPDVEFAVVLFGNKAEPLKSTVSFLKATRANRARVVQELEAIVPGPKDAAHPNGTLRGETNVYEAFVLGLAPAAGRGPSPSRGAGEPSGRTAVSASDARAMEACADTIYLLSDGVPTRDGFRGTTPAVESGGYWMPPTPEQEGEREVLINPETGATRKERYKIPAQPRRFVPKAKVSGADETGPYIFQEPLSEEVRRLNLFIRATVHVVAIGEAGTYLCAELARAGGGRCLRISPSGERENL